MEQKAELSVSFLLWDFCGQGKHKGPGEDVADYWWSTCGVPWVSSPSG